MKVMATMDPRASSTGGQMNNSPFDFTSDEVHKLDEVLSSDSVKQILSDTKSFEHLAATILDNHGAGPESSHNLTSSSTVSQTNMAVAPGHVATVQEGLDLVDALDSLVNQLTRDQPNPSQPEVDLLGGNLEIGSTAGPTHPMTNAHFIDTIMLDHPYACHPVRQRIPFNDDCMASSPSVSSSTVITPASNLTINTLSSRDPEHSFTYNTASSSSFSPPSTPQRRSQRQIERSEKTILEKIKAENAEMLKREKEEMEAAKLPRSLDGEVPRRSFDTGLIPEGSIKKEDTEDEEKGEDGLIIDFGHSEKKKIAKKRGPVPGSTSGIKKKKKPSSGSNIKIKTEDGASDSIDQLQDSTNDSNDGKEKNKSVSQRSQRQRRKPKRWDDDEVEVDFSGTASELANELSSSPTKKDDVKTEPESTEKTVSSDEENEFNDEDDPNKLWCICRKPHGGRFMIECDECSDWYHGKCVGVTKAKAAKFEEEKKKWFCPKCRAKSKSPKVVVKQEPTLSQPSKSSIEPTTAIISSPPTQTTNETIFSEQTGSIVAPTGPVSSEATATVSDATSTATPISPVISGATSQVGQTSPKKPIKAKSSEGKEILAKKKLKNENHMKIGDILKQRKIKAAGGNIALVEKKEASRLKKLIKSSKLDLKKKMTKGEKHSTPKLTAAATTATPETEKDKEKDDNKWEPISKVVPLIRKQEEKKKKIKITPIDPSFNDLFKAEPIKVAKKVVSSGQSTPTTPTTPGAITPSLKRPPLSGDSSSAKKLLSPAEVNCVSCGKTVVKSAIKGKEFSIYCTEVCLEKHVKDSLEIIKQARAHNANVNGSKSEKLRINLVEKSTGRLLSGSSAPSEDKVLEYIKSNPTFEVMRPNLVRRQSSQSSSSVDHDSKKKEGHKSTISHTKGSSSKKQKEEGNAKQKPSENTAKSESRRDDGSAENIRHNVRKVLKETLQTRCQEADNKMLGDDIKKIAFKIEEELFLHFNKETSNKYKTRYRSLVFNLKDTKNQGLFRKVLTGSISPERLVRMSHDELASSELAKWRERENKHALEMIKRDAEAMAQQVIVKKTHKGEEVIETKTSIETIDPTKEEELLKNSDPVLSDVKTPSTPSKDKIVSTPFSALELLRDSKLDKRKGEDTTDKHGQHLFDSHCKICTKTSEQDLSLSHPKSTNKTTTSPSRTLNEQCNKTPNQPQPKRVRVEFDEPTNRIIEEAVKLSKSSKSLNSANESSIYESSEDLLPSSTVTSSPEVKSNPIPSCWKGFIFMQDVAKFVASAYKISGIVDNRLKDVPDTIIVCGRIAPEQVLDYLKKLKSTRTDIAIIQFAPTNHEERTDYEKFFDYLNRRKRYGVVGPAGKSIKDFYILPLPREAEIPEVLLPFDGPGIPSNRPNLLLGILVKNKKHPVKSIIKEKVPIEDKNKELILASIKEQPERSYTPPPPGSSSKADETLNEEPYDPGLSLTPPRKEEPREQPKRQNNELDEPYDPEENDLHNIPSTSVPPKQPRRIIVEILEQLSRSSNPGELSKTIYSTIAKDASVDETKLLLEALNKRVEDFKRKLEEQRKAAEAAFSIASQTIDNIGKVDSIPGLDGSYPTDEETNEQPSSDFSSFKLSENLKEVLESIQAKAREPEKADETEKNNNDDQRKLDKRGLIFEDPIVKNFGQENLDDDYEDEEDYEMNDEELSLADQDMRTERKNPEPMEIDDEEAKRINALEVDTSKARVDPRLRSKRQRPLAAEIEGKPVSELKDDELKLKARLQLNALKKMEKQQQCLEEARNQAMAALNSASVSGFSLQSQTPTSFFTPATSSSTITPMLHASTTESTITSQLSSSSTNPASVSSSISSMDNTSSAPVAKLKIEWKKTCKQLPKL